jgi:low affinity Fe/Cu permease
MKYNEYASKACIKIADWSSHPIAIVIFPVACFAYLRYGGEVNTLTLILSIVAISLTQMVLRAQNVDAEASKLQMAELVKSNPKANNKVIKEDLSHEQIIELKEEINDAISKEL